MQLSIKCTSLRAATHAQRRVRVLKCSAHAATAYSSQRTRSNCPRAACVSTPIGRSRPSALRDVSTAAAANVPDSSPSKFSGKVLALLAFLLLVGVSNRVLYRMALVPMTDYIFFLAQLTTFGYVLIYLSILFARAWSGVVTPAMLKIPFQMLPSFLLIGFLEGVSGLLIMIGASHLSGAVLPLLGQSYLAWNLLFVWLILRQRLSIHQVLGALTVSLGVVIAALPDSASSLHFDPKYATLCVCAYALPALDSIIKEKVFTDAKARLGQPLDIFVVNSFGSLFQAVMVSFLLPVMTQLRGLSWDQMPQYIGDGCTCLLGGVPSTGSNCTGAPLLPLLYVAFNLVFNITALYLLRQLGNVTLSLSMAVVVPLSILAFCLPLPLLEPAVLGPSFITGAVVLLFGMLLYNSQSWGLKLPWFAKGTGAAGAV